MPAGAEQVAAGAATRAALIAAARELFVANGFFATGTNAIVDAAAVTRGALYHHFSDKVDLFRAVVDQVTAEIIEGQIAEAAADPDPTRDDWDDLEAGLLSVLRQLASSRELQQLLIVDGPAALGWHEWGQVQARIALASITGAVDDAIEAGLIDPLPSETLASMLLGVLNAAAAVVTVADDREAALAEVEVTIGALMRGLRSSP